MTTGFGELAEARATFFQRAKGDEDWVETTKAYVGALRAAGAVTIAPDGEVLGRVPGVGPTVHLGHILECSEREDWARLGDYLTRCPSPEDW